MKLNRDNLFGKTPRTSSLKLLVPYEKDKTINPIGETIDKIMTETNLTLLYQTVTGENRNLKLRTDDIYWSI